MSGSPVHGSMTAGRTMPPAAMQAWAKQHSEATSASETRGQEHEGTGSLKAGTIQLQPNMRIGDILIGPKLGQGADKEVFAALVNGQQMVAYLADQLPKAGTDVGRLLRGSLDLGSGQKVVLKERLFAGSDIIRAIPRVEDNKGNRIRAFLNIITPLVRSINDNIHARHKMWSDIDSGNWGGRFSQNDDGSLTLAAVPMDTDGVRPEGEEDGSSFKIGRVDAYSARAGKSIGRHTDVFQIGHMIAAGIFQMLASDDQKATQKEIATIRKTAISEDEAVTDGAEYAQRMFEQRDELARLLNSTELAELQVETKRAGILDAQTGELRTGDTTDLTRRAVEMSDNFMVRVVREKLTEALEDPGLSRAILNILDGALSPEVEAPAPRRRLSLFEGSDTEDEPQPLRWQSDQVAEALERLNLGFEGDQALTQELQEEHFEDIAFRGAKEQRNSASALKRARTAATTPGVSWSESDVTEAGAATHDVKVGESGHDEDAESHEVRGQENRPPNPRTPFGGRDADRLAVGDISLSKTPGGEESDREEETVEITDAHRAFFRIDNEPQQAQGAEPSPVSSLGSPFMGGRGLSFRATPGSGGSKASQPSQGDEGDDPFGGMMMGMGGHASDAEGSDGEG